MSFKGRKHTEESNMKRSETIKRLHAEGSVSGMGFKRKYYTVDEARSAKAEKNRERQLKHRYGITVEKYEEMLEGQNGQCAVCGATESIRNTGYMLHVDHNHITGKVRGLLCTTCNKALGFLESSSMEGLIDYIKLYEPELTNMMKAKMT